MATTLETNVREAKAKFYAVWNRIKKGSIFRGLYGTEPATEGSYKAAGIIVPGEFGDFTGTATINALDGASKTYNTRLREHTLGMDFNTMKKADAITSGGVKRSIMGGAGMALQDIEKLLTALLETGETATWMDSQLFFDDTHAVPNSAVVIDNLLSGAWTDSATEFRAMCWAMKAAFDNMRNANNYLYHDDENVKIIVMYDPAIEAFAQDAINPEAGAGGTTARLDKLISLRSNPYLADADDCYGFLEGGDGFSSLIWAEEEAPNFVTNLDNMGDTERIKHNQVLFQARHAGIEAFGSPMHVVKGLDA